MVKFKVYVGDEDLKEVNISSLLFYSNNVICDLFVGDIRASLIVNGEIRILNEENNEIYKHYGAFTEEMKKIIRNGESLENYNYIIDMSNWFELFIDKIDENGNVIKEIGCEVADIEGALDNNDLKSSLFEFMLNSIKEYTEIEDFDIMTLDEKEEDILKSNIVKMYENYSKLAENKENKVDEELGRNIYMNSNHKIIWLEYEDNEENNQSILVEVK